MTLPEELSITSNSILTQLSFDLKESSENGMWKYYRWTNTTMGLLFIYDRGYYVCEIVPHNEPANKLGLIRLLRFLKNDKTFYKKELIEANLWYSLTIDEYVELFRKNYDLITNFLKNYNHDKYDQYDKFEFSFDGLKNGFL